MDEEKEELNKIYYVERNVLDKIYENAEKIFKYNDDDFSYEGYGLSIDRELTNTHDIITISYGKEETLVFYYSPRFWNNEGVYVPGKWEDVLKELCKIIPSSELNNKLICKNNYINSINSSFKDKDLKIQRQFDKEAEKHLKKLRLLKH